MNLLKKIGLLGVLATTPVFAQSREVYLEARTYNGYEIPADTTVIGNLPTQRIQDLKEQTMKDGQVPKDLVDNQYTIIEGPLSFGGDCAIENCQLGLDQSALELLGSIGYIATSGNAVRNCVIYNNLGTEQYDEGFGSSENNEFTNNYITGFDAGLNLQPPAGSIVLDRNFFTDNESAIYTCHYGDEETIGSGALEGNNFFYKNELNLNNEEANPVRFEGNFWYDTEGTLLNTEEEILDTCNVVADTRTKNISSLIDVVPFKTVEPLWTRPAPFDRPTLTEIISDAFESNNVPQTYVPSVVSSFMSIMRRIFGVF